MCCRVRWCPEALACGVFAAGARGPVGVCKLAANRGVDQWTDGCLTAKRIRAVDGLCDGSFRCSPSVAEIPRSPPITGDRGLEPARDSTRANSKDTRLHNTTRHTGSDPWRPDTQPSGHTVAISQIPQRLNNSTHIQHNHASSQSQFSIHLVNVFTGNFT
jgi:hypothetical protein